MKGLKELMHVKHLKEYQEHSKHGLTICKNSSWGKHRRWKKAPWSLELWVVAQPSHLNCELLLDNLGFICNFIIYSTACDLIHWVIHSKYVSLKTNRVRNRMGNQTHPVPCPHVALILMSRLCLCTGDISGSCAMFIVWLGLLLSRYVCASGEQWPGLEPLFTSLAMAQFLMPSPQPLSFSSCLPVSSYLFCFWILWELGSTLLNILRAQQCCKSGSFQSSYLEMIYCLTSAVGSIMSLVVIVVGCKPASSKSRILGLQFPCFTFPSYKFKKQIACGWMGRHYNCFNVVVIHFKGKCCLLARC